MQAHRGFESHPVRHFFPYSLPDGCRHVRRKSARSGKVIIPGHYRGAGRWGGDGVEFFFGIGFEVFQVGVGMDAVLMIMVRDPLVLDDAAQFQAELDGTQCEGSAVVLHRVGDDLPNLPCRLFECRLMVGLALCPELIDPDANFRLVHQVCAALFRAVGRVAGPSGRFGPAGVAGHRLAERFLPVRQADGGRVGSGKRFCGCWGHGGGFASLGSITDFYPMKLTETQEQLASCRYLCRLTMA
nr:hypothetical protein [Skermanella aerolata]